MKFAKYAKAYIALLGSVLTALSGITGLIPDPVQPYITLALAVITALGTMRIPNTSQASDA